MDLYWFVSIMRNNSLYNVANHMENFTIMPNRYSVFHSLQSVIFHTHFIYDNERFKSFTIDLLGNL